MIVIPVTTTSVVLVVDTSAVAVAWEIVGVSAMVMAPAALVIVIPLPAVMFAATGAEPVEPINNCPLFNAAASVMALPEETIIRLLFKVAEELVPPLATGKVPVKLILPSVDKAILPLAETGIVPFASGKEYILSTVAALPSNVFT